MYIILDISTQPQSYSLLQELISRVFDAVGAVSFLGQGKGCGCQVPDHRPPKSLGISNQPHDGQADSSTSKSPPNKQLTSSTPRIIRIHFFGGNKHPPPLHQCSHHTHTRTHPLIAPCPSEPSTRNPLTHSPERKTHPTYHTTQTPTSTHRHNVSR
jgi:hypothetical protein